MDDDEVTVMNAPRANEMQLHLTMLILPPAPMIDAGAKEERYTCAVPGRDAAAAVAENVKRLTCVEITPEGEVL